MFLHMVMAMCRVENYSMLTRRKIEITELCDLNNRTTIGMHNIVHSCINKGMDGYFLTSVTVSCSAWTRNKKPRRQTCGDGISDEVGVMGYIGFSSLFCSLLLSSNSVITGTGET